MEVRISGVDKSERNTFLDEFEELLGKTKGPFRLSKIADEKNHRQVLFLRERTWGEFFFEKLILTPQKMQDIQNEALAAIELAFFLLEEAPKGQAEKESSKSEENFVPCLDELADGMPSRNSSDSSYEPMGYDINFSVCKDMLKCRVLDKDDSEIEMQPTKPGCIRTSNGLLTVPKGISVSTCPALQVIAHNAVVSSVGAVSVRRVQPYSVLQRAVEAFKSAWGDLPVKTLPKRGEGGIFIYKENLMSKAGLRHIQKVMCIPDDKKRDDKSALAGAGQRCWESLYENCCRNAEGSVVLELYPDYYENDQKALGGRRAFYSQANIKGAVDAAVKVRKEMRGNGKEPVSIIFAGMDQNTYTRICNELKKSGVQ